MKKYCEKPVKVASLALCLLLTTLSANGVEAALDMLCRKTFVGGTFNNTTIECVFTWSTLDESIYPDGDQSALALGPNGITIPGNFEFDAPSQPFNMHDPYLLWSTPGSYSVESSGMLSFSWVSGENPNVIEVITIQPSPEWDAFTGVLP